MRFEDTHPLPEQQQRLRRWRHVPNFVPLAQRLLLGLVAATWTAWALVGVVSGHMYLMLRGPVHFSGIAAFVFSASVLLAAAACLVPVIDHYDRRNNEASYGRLRRWLWWAVAAIALCAVLVGCVGRAGLGVPGLLDARHMADLSFSPAIARALQPLSRHLGLALWASVCWLVLGVLYLRIFRGVRTSSQVSPHASLFFAYFVFAPVVLAGTLQLLLWICGGDAAAHALRQGQAEARMAFAWSMLVAALGVLALLAVLGLITVGRLLTGRPLFPPVAPPASPDPEA